MVLFAGGLRDPHGRTHRFEMRVFESGRRHMAACVANKKKTRRWKNEKFYMAVHSALKRCQREQKMHYVSGWQHLRTHTCGASCSDEHLLMPRNGDHTETRARHISKRSHEQLDNLALLYT